MIKKYACPLCNKMIPMTRQSIDAHNCKSKQMPKGIKMAKIIPFTGITQLDFPPDRILEAAMGELEGVIIIGYDKNNKEYFASSYADGGTVLWLLERCKNRLMHIEIETGKEEV
jgi:hypothetical protein